MSAPVDNVWDARLARAYRDTRGLSDETREDWTRAMRSVLPEQRLARLVDVGCGTGRFAALLVEMFGGHVVGIDSAPAMLAERDPALDTHASFVAATADRVPLRSACADLLLFSMVYHLLADRAAAIAEARRLVRAGGWVVVRTPTREVLPEIEFLRFFPGALAVDEARMPERAHVDSAFTSAGFARHAHATVWQTFAASPMAAYAKVSQRAFSTLRLIGDDGFEEGLRRYEAHCRTAPRAPIRDPLDLFVFRAAGAATRGSG